MKKHLLGFVLLFGILTVTRADTIYHAPDGHYSIIVPDGQDSPYLDTIQFFFSHLVLRGSFGITGTGNAHQFGGQVETSFLLHFVPDAGWSFSTVSAPVAGIWGYHNGWGGGHQLWTNWSIDPTGVTGSHYYPNFPPGDQGGGGGGQFFGFGGTDTVVPAGGFSIEFDQKIVVYSTSALGFDSIHFDLALVNTPAPPPAVPEVSPTMGLLLASLGLMGLIQRRLHRMA